MDGILLFLSGDCCYFGARQCRMVQMNDWAKPSMELDAAHKQFVAALSLLDANPKIDDVTRDAVMGHLQACLVALEEIAEWVRAH